MKNYKHIYVTLTFLLIGIAAYAQQREQYSMYMFNTLAVNPAYAASRDMPGGVLLYRDQWGGVKGAPVTQMATFYTPLRNDALALGLSVVNDIIGSTNNMGITGDFAYKIRLNRYDDRLAFGVKTGVDIYNADFTDLEVVDNTDELYYTPVNNKPLFKTGFGVYYFSKKHYVGISTPQMLNNDIAEVGQSLAEQKMHLYLMGGYVFKLSSSVYFKPSVLSKYTHNAPLSYDINLSFLFHEKLWLGAMYRGNEVGANIVFYFTDFLRAGYAYDYSTTDINDISSGSHEIMIGFDLRTRKRRVKSTMCFF